MTSCSSSVGGTYIKPAERPNGRVKPLKGAYPGPNMSTEKPTARELEPAGRSRRKGPGIIATPNRENQSQTLDQTETIHMTVHKGPGGDPITRRQNTQDPLDRSRKLRGLRKTSKLQRVGVSRGNANARPQVGRHLMRRVLTDVKGVLKRAEKAKKMPGDVGGNITGSE